MNLSALNAQGSPVDWWFSYKVPELKKGDLTVEAKGYESLYFDASTPKALQSPELMTDPKSALGRTLDGLFKNPSETTGWFLYNDEMPGDTKRKDQSSYGHTKGVVAYDTKSKSAFWLLHSWPKYSDPKAVAMPTPIYGQTFLCISIDIATASSIAKQMMNHQQPQVYFPRVPETLDKTDPLYLITKDVQPNAAGDSDILECSSRGGMHFKVIAKNRKWDKDFWNDLVGPALKSDMDVETWIRGPIPPVLDSDGKHHVYDVKFIDLRPLGMPYCWPETSDHAKWGITKDSDWICVGDINRMISQEKRGGGTIAFQNKTLWTALQKTDLLKPPPGKTVADVKKIILKTQG